MPDVTLYWIPTIESQGSHTIFYFVSHPDWPGVNAQGWTTHQALERWHENRADREKDMIADGLEIPTPSKGCALWCDHPISGYWHKGNLTVWLEKVSPSNDRQVEPS